MIIIIACILLALMALVLLSRYRIPRGILKAFSYITFVMVFEFIVFLLDTKIHNWAHGEPLKIMVVKVILIAILLPIHHATDYRVLEYLTRKNLINNEKSSFKYTFKYIFSSFREWLNIHKSH